MSKYELDPADANYLVGVLMERNSQQASELADRIRYQIPIPMPVKVGAVVRTYAGALFLRTSTWDNAWCEIVPNSQTSRWFNDDDLPRITEVLSPGVDV